jgi:hypothetical protein
MDGSLKLPLVPRTPLSTQMTIPPSRTGSRNNASTPHSRRPLSQAQYASGSVSARYGLPPTTPSLLALTSSRALTTIPESAMSSQWPNGGALTSRSSDGACGRSRPTPQLAEDLLLFLKRETMHLGTAPSTTAREGFDFTHGSDGMTTARADSRPNDTASVFERARIASEAFRVFVERFQEYSEFLGYVRSELDAALRVGAEAVTVAERLQRSSFAATDMATHTLISERVVFEATITEKDRKIAELESTVAALKHKIESNASAMQENEARRVAAEAKFADIDEKNQLLLQNIKHELVQRSLMVQQGKQLKLDNEKLLRKIGVLEYKIRNELLVKETDASSSSSPTGAERDPSSPASARARAAASWREAGQLKRDGAEVGVGNTEAMQLEERFARLQYLFKEERKEKVRLQRQLKEEDRLDRPLTPRPQWGTLTAVLPDWRVPTGSRMTSDKVLAKVIEAIKERVMEESKDIEIRALSDAMRRWLGTEGLCDSDLLRGRAQTFVGRGTGPSVPVFLRFHGHLRQRNLSKGAVEDLIQEFWADRRSYLRGETDHLRALQLQDYFLDWLVRKVGNQYGAIELAYNMDYVSGMFMDDPDCLIFQLVVIRQEVSEAAQFEQQEVVDQLLSAIKHYDRNEVGIVKRQRIYLLLLKLFPAKSRDAHLRLRFALLAHTNPTTDDVRYLELFEQDRNGNQSRFLTFLRSQWVTEMREYMVDVEEAVRGIVAQSGGSQVTLGAIRNAVRYLDPKLPASVEDQMIAGGSGIAVQTVSASHDLDDTYVDVETFLTKLRLSTLLQRYSVKQEESSLLDLRYHPELDLGRGDSDEEDGDGSESHSSASHHHPTTDPIHHDPGLQRALAEMDAYLLSSMGLSNQAPLPPVVQDVVALVTPATAEAIQNIHRKRSIAPSK